MFNPDRHHLPRLDRSRYQALAAVHWRMRIEPREAGWLGEPWHLQFRELVLHACAREKLFCPVYCLMPDHLHLMWLGLAPTSDQLNGMKFLRTYLNRLLAGEAVRRRDSPAPSRAQLPALSRAQLPAPSRAQLPALSRAQPPALSRAQPRWRLQPQAYDHVLREEERRQGAFAKVCFYIAANPVRAGLVVAEKDWPFSGAVIPGYPDLDPLGEGYWQLFWRLYSAERDEAPCEPLKG